MLVFGDVIVFCSTWDLLRSGDGAHRVLSPRLSCYVEIKFPSIWLWFQKMQQAISIGLQEPILHNISASG